MPPSAMRFSSASLTLGMHHRDAARLAAELGQRVERHLVVGDIGRGLHAPRSGWCRSAFAAAGSPRRPRRAASARRAAPAETARRRRYACGSRRRRPGSAASARLCRMNWGPAWKAIYTASIPPQSMLCSVHHETHSSHASRRLRRSDSRGRLGRRASPRLGRHQVFGGLCAGRQRRRHPPHLDLRRHVLDLRHPGPRSEDQG